MNANLKSLIFLFVSILSNDLCAASAYHIEFHGVKYDVFGVNRTQDTIRFMWKDSNGGNFSSFGAVKEYLARQEKTLVFATNGGIFDRNRAPLGLYVENGVELNALNTQHGHGNFYLMPNGVFYVAKTKFGIVKTAQFARLEKDILYATQSGPMLVDNGRINPRFNKTSDSFYVRSGVGVDKSGNAIYAISNSAVNFYALALLFREKLHCRNALYLDGAISKMYLPKLGRQELEGSFAVIIAVVQ
jgi:uncharacterized protein YigE (DUF2233 family)